jgi:hypothetical protein
LGKPVAQPAPLPQSLTPVPPQPGRLSLPAAIKEYLDEKQAHKRKRSYQAYANAVNQFGAICKKATVQQVDRQDLLAYATFLARQKEQTAHSLQPRLTRAHFSAPLRFAFPAFKEKGRHAQLHKEDCSQVW